MAASVLVVCLGVGLATVTDPQISSNLAGLAAGFGSVAATALYQIWAGSKQKELGLGSMQLLHQYVPLAAGLLALLVPLCEPMGSAGAPPGSLLGYQYTPGAVVAIAVSSVLGLLVNLSTFLVGMRLPARLQRTRAPPRRPRAAASARPPGRRSCPSRAAPCAAPLSPHSMPWLAPPAAPGCACSIGRLTQSYAPHVLRHPAIALLPTSTRGPPRRQVIGATSSLTYNVVGHIKTVLILSGGVAFFGDTMPPKKAAGILAAMGGIVWWAWAAALLAAALRRDQRSVMDSGGFEGGLWDEMGARGPASVRGATSGAACIHCRLARHETGTLGWRGKPVHPLLPPMRPQVLPDQAERGTACCRCKAAAGAVDGGTQR